MERTRMSHTRLFVLCLAAAGIVAACNDDSAKGSSDIQPENTEALCIDGIDNDNNGKTDCDEDDCQWFAACGSTLVPENTKDTCTDGKDNDKNGWTDCDEPECMWFAECQKTENTPKLCADGLDNDKSGAADCADTNCQTLDICHDKTPETTEELCTDGQDNDENGPADCQDANCKVLSVCLKPENTEALCNDNSDNDNNGHTDCDDPNCKQFAHCKGNITVECTANEASCPSENLRKYCDDNTWKTEYCAHGCNASRCQSCTEKYGQETCVEGIHTYCSDNDQRISETCEFDCNSSGSQCQTCEQKYGEANCINGKHPDVLISLSQTEINEDGGSATATFTLSTEPSADVLLSLALSGDGKDEAQLKNSNNNAITSLALPKDKWNEGITVNLVALEDDIIDGDKSVSIDITSSSDDAHFDSLTASASVRLIDSNGIKLIIDKPQHLTTSEDGDSVDFGFRLGSKPSADVTIGLSLSNNDYAEIKNAKSDKSYDLVFTPTNWKQKKTVTIVGKDDGKVFNSPDHIYTLDFKAARSSDTNYNGLTNESISLTNLDNDLPTIVTSDLKLTEGQESSLQIELSPAPTTDTTITASAAPSDNCTITGDPTLVFTAADSGTKKSLTVMVPDDEMLNPGKTCTITLTGASSDTDIKSTYNQKVKVLEDIPIQDDDKAEIRIASKDYGEASSIYSKNSSQIRGGGCPSSKCTSSFKTCYTLGVKPASDVTLSFSMSREEYNNALEASPKTLTINPDNYNNITANCVTFTDVFDYRWYIDHPGLIYDIVYANIVATASSSDPNFDGKSVKIASTAGWGSFNDKQSSLLYTQNQYNYNGHLTVEEGKTMTLYLWLYQPRDTRSTFRLDSRKCMSAVAKQRLTFSPSTFTVEPGSWYQRITIKVTAIDDDENIGDEDGEYCVNMYAFENDAGITVAFDDIYVKDND